MFKTIKSVKRFPHFSHVHLEQRIEVIVYVNELLCMFILVAQTHGHAENQSLLQKYRARSKVCKFYKLRQNKMVLCARSVKLKWLATVA